MFDNEYSVPGTLPVISDKELLEMNQLMVDKRYRIKLPAGFLRLDRAEKINPDFVLYTLNDYLGHIQKCVASTRKMLPFDDNARFYSKLEKVDETGYKLVMLVKNIDIKQLSAMLLVLQRNPRDVTMMQLVPLIHLLFQSLIIVYYLGATEVSRKYKNVYSFVLKEVIPEDPEGLKSHTSSAIEEWHYIFDQIYTGLYPLVLRMCSPAMLTMHQLFYAHGSRVLAWLRISPSVVLIKNDQNEDRKAEVEEALPEPEISADEENEVEQVPDEVQEGLAILEKLFPEAGWDVMETMPDLCPYFQPILQFQDGFTQLAPENPLHQTMILLWILEELFQGLRLIKFEPLQPLSALEDTEDINTILEEWILYQENVFDKNFSLDLKEYTHQIYTQPEYYKNPYGRKLLSNMYTLLKTAFLPYFDIRLYGSAKMPKDDRLPPFFIRVIRLKKLLSRYNYAIQSAAPGSEQNATGSVPGVQNPWATYKFDIPNPVSKRLDAICGGKYIKSRTNALLIQYTLSILNVLDWWINNKESFAYKQAPDYLYRVIEPGSAVPAFGVKARTDVESLFLRHLKGTGFGINQ